jgi:hypothetical protein
MGTAAVIAGAVVITTGSVCGLARALVAYRIAQLACAAARAEPGDVPGAVAGLLGLARVCAGDATAPDELGDQQ